MLDRQTGIRRILAAWAAAAAVLCGAEAPADQKTDGAANYPHAPVHVITGYGAGSPPDVIARLIAPKLAERLGQPVVVENRTGAGSTLGAAAVASARADGYTVLVAGTSDLAVARSMGAPLRYDSERDFEPVILVANHPFWIVVPGDLGVGSLSDLVALAKARPGQLAYASAGAGNLTHLAGELLKAASGAEMLHVPFKTGGAAIADTLAGRVALYVAPMLGTQQHVASKRLRALAVTSASRSPLSPDVPTVAEAGYPAVEVSGLTAFLVPRGTPGPIVARLNAEINQILAQPEVREHFVRLASEVVGGEPEALRVRIHSDIAKWSGLVKSRGLQVN